jgi:hypothetical protein
MGLGDLIDSVGDSLEDLATGAEHLTGKVVDGGSHLIGDGLDAVGLHGAAQSVDNFGDNVADHLGDQVAEKQLGQSDDPTQLMHGDVGAILQTASRLQQFATAFGETAQGLAGVDTADWQGATADAFRQVYQVHPRQWADAQDACTTASGAWRTFGDAVASAQGQARDAIALYQQADRATQAAQARYDQAQATYNQQAWAYVHAVAAGRDPGPQTQPPGPFSDPGVAGRQHAQDLLTAARQARDSAAETAQRALNEATAHAPTKPKFTQRMLDDLGDATTVAGVEGEHFLGGALKGVGDLGKFTRSLLPLDPYNITHPAEYVDGLSSTAAGLVHTALHPMSLVTGLLGSGWGSDPAEALGRLVPNLVGMVGTDGVSDATDAAEAASTASTTSRAAEALTHDGDGAAATDAGQGFLPSSAADGPTVHAGLGPTLNPVDVQRISGDLGTVDRDLATIHVHAPESTTLSAAPTPPQVHVAPPPSIHVGPDSGDSSIQQRLAGLDTGADLPPPPDPAGAGPGGSLPPPDPPTRPTAPTGGSGDGPLSHDPQVHADLAHTAIQQPDLSLLDHSEDSVVWRRDHDTLYRGGNRGPVVFSDGFTPHDMTQLDLRSHVIDNTPSGYTSTTRNPLYWETWGSGAKYLYEIDAPGGIDINASLGSQYDYEQEIAMPGGLRGERVKGLWPVMRDPVSLRPYLGDYVPNPHYRPLPSTGP